MSTLRYVGKYPDSDGAVVDKVYIDNQYAALKVDNAYVDTQIAANDAAMVSNAYVDSGDGTRAHKTAVDSADATFVPTTQAGAANGVASIGSDGYIPSGQVPSVITDRVPVIVAGTISLTAVHTVTTTATKEFQAGTLTISDPGYPYQALPFVAIQGAASSAATPATVDVGTGCYGKVSVLGPGDVVFAQCITSGNYVNDFAHALPYAALNQSSSTMTGSLTLDLWLALWSGTTYTFSPTNLQYYAIVLPAI